MLWTAIIVASAVSLGVFAGLCCRRANKLIERILVDELGPERISRRDVPWQPDRTRAATEERLARSSVGGPAVGSAREGAPVPVPHATHSLDR
jgi:hypothetical protein